MLPSCAGQRQVKQVQPPGDHSKTVEKPISGLLDAKAAPSASFVLGIFQDSPGGPDRAVRDLLSRAFSSKQLLLIAEDKLDGKPQRHPVTIAEEGQHRVKCCHFTHLADGDQVLRRASLLSGPAFAPLWQSLRSHQSHQTEAKDLHPGASRQLYHHLTNHMSGGAVVLIVSIESADQQRNAARALLDCKCNVLLTHAVTPRQT
jgi:hypothetical protein